MHTFSFGLIADPQYADKPPQINRFYRNAIGKTQKAMDILKREGVDFLICLGDVIDGAQNAWQSERDCLKMQETILSLEKPCHYVLGNHDVNALHRERLMALWNFPDQKGYYSFHCAGTQFIVLDTNFDQSGRPYLPGTGIWDESHINPQQLEWLENELAASVSSCSIILSHALLDGAENRHTVKNAQQVRRILEHSGKEHIVFQGHYHPGHSSLIGGIPYLTLKGMADGAEDFSCWAVTVSGGGVHADIHTSGGVTGIDILKQA